MPGPLFSILSAGTGLLFVFSRSIRYTDKQKKPKAPGGRAAAPLHRNDLDRAPAMRGAEKSAAPDGGTAGRTPGGKNGG